jgi:hypothetical protein
MKKLVLLTAAVTTLAIAGCNKKNPEQLDENVQTSENTSDNLNALSDQAANLASEAQQLENQANQLNTEAASIDDAKGPQTKNDEDIQGM